jgi:hypothetical protein
MATGVRHARERTLLFLTTPALWPQWPFLPVVRRTRGVEELGVVFDSRAAGLTGFSATVFHSNLYLLPPTLARFLELPRDTYNSAEELIASGWAVD